MKGRLVAITLVLLTVLNAVNAISYTITPINDTALPGGDLYYDITFECDWGPEQDITVKCDPIKTVFNSLVEGSSLPGPGVGYTSCSVLPSFSFTIEPYEEAHTVRVRIGVPDSAYPSGRYQYISLPIIIEESFHNEKEEVMLKYSILGELPSVIEYVEVEVEVEVNPTPDYSKVTLSSFYFPTEISDTRIGQSFSFVLNNELRDRLGSEVEIKVMKDQEIIQTVADTLNIEGLDDSTYIKAIKLEDKQAPGMYSIDLKVAHQDNVVISKRVYFKVNGYSDIAIDEAEDFNLLEKTVVIGVANDGTLTGEREIQKPINFLDRLLVIGNSGATITGDAIAWDVSVNPGEVKTVGYRVSYFPLFIMPLIVVAIAYIYWFNNRGVVITKDLTEKKQAEHATEGKMVIKFKNITNNPFRDVVLVEKVPEFVSQIGNFSPMKPEVIKKKEGHELIWKIDQMAPKEERILTYTLKTKLGLLGNIRLPSSKISFYNKGGKLKMRKSNPLAFLGEYRN